MHAADRGGKSSLTSRAIYRVTVYFRLKTYQREEKISYDRFGPYAGHHAQLKQCSCKALKCKFNAPINLKPAEGVGGGQGMGWGFDCYCWPWGGAFD